MTDKIHRNQNHKCVHPDVRIKTCFFNLFTGKQKPLKYEGQKMDV
jgi:hypothetical protein